jgi:hypothetical protein
MLGSVINSVEKVEKSVVRWIERTRYKEISENLLLKNNSISFLSEEEKTKPPTKKRKKDTEYVLKRTETSLPIRFHLLDLLGRGVLFKVASPANNDFILRLNK